MHQHARPSRRSSFVFALAGAAVAVFGASTGVVRAEPGIHKTGTEKFDRQMEPVLDRYLRIGSALSADSLDGVREKARTIAKLAAGLDPGTVSGEHAGHYKTISANLEKPARSLAAAQSLDSARGSFKELSKPMAMWVTMAKPANIDVLYCSMAKGSWVQKHGKVSNPYYGPKMLECGDVVGGTGTKNDKP